MNIQCNKPNTSNYINCHLCFAHVFKKNLTRHMNSERCKRSYRARINSLEYNPFIHNIDKNDHDNIHTLYQIILKENKNLKEQINRLHSEINYYKLSTDRNKQFDDSHAQKTNISLHEKTYHINFE